jgi:hypothetical protein
VSDGRREIVGPASEPEAVAAEVAEAAASVPTEYVRVELEPLASKQLEADVRLARAAEAADECATCGEPIDEGLFCGYECLVEGGGDG